MDKDATEDILPELGDSSKTLVSLPEIYMETTNGADLTLWNLVIITLLENINLAQVILEPLPVTKNVLPNPEEPMLAIKLNQRALTALWVKPKFKLN